MVTENGGTHQARLTGESMGWSPTFTRERILAGEVTQRQTFGFMRGSSRRVLGPLFDSDVWDRSMRPAVVMGEGRPINPAFSPYVAGMLRVAHALAIQDHLEGIDPANAYIATRIFLHAERFRRFEEAERDVTAGKGIDASQVIAWNAADDDGKKAIVTQAINNIADSGKQRERARAMAGQLASFAQEHELGEHIPLLDGLARIPLLDEDRQEDALIAVLPGLSALPPATFAPEPVEQVHAPVVTSDRAESPRRASRALRTEIRRERKQGPDIEGDLPLSDEEFGTLMASALNHLGKILVIMAMQYNKPYSESGLGRETAALQNASRGWPSMDTGKNAMGYCRNSLALAGLITTVVVDGHDQVQLSDYGWRMRGVAGHLGVLSERFPHYILGEALGNTASSNAKATIVATAEGEVEYKRRAALTRYKIFEVLLASKHLPIAQHELIKRLGPDFDRGIVSDTLDRMGRNGIIMCDGIKNNTRFSYFEPVENPPSGDPKMYGVREPLRVVMDWIRTTHGPFNIDDFASVPANQHIMATWSTRVVKIFSDLVDLGYLRRAGQGFDSKDHSAIDLKPQQREFLTELTRILKEVQRGKGEFLAEGDRLIDEILNSSDKRRYTALMRKAQRDSRQANSQSTKTTKEEIVEIVNDPPPGLHVDSDQVQQALTFVYERRYSRPYIMKLLAELAEEGRITRIKRGSQHHYTPVVEADPTENGAV